jgi:hypothetical protein
MRLGGGVAVDPVVVHDHLHREGGLLRQHAEQCLLDVRLLVEGADDHRDRCHGGLPSSALVGETLSGPRVEGPLPRPARQVLGVGGVGGLT